MPRHLTRRMPLRFRPWLSHEAWSDVMDPRPVGGRFRAVRRISCAVLWTLISLPIQGLMVLLPGRPKIVFARVYHAVLCRLLGLKVRVVGEPVHGRSVLYLSNHSSWLDILVLGSVLEAVFVAKSEVGQWPVIGTVARLGRTIFVSRRRGTTGQEADAMREALAAGGSVILFPEGTSNDGTRTLPLRSSFLAVADKAETVQPLSVVYDRVGGLPACRRDRPIFAWYGDMEIGTHLWRLARRPSARVTVLLHESCHPSDYADRKALTRAVSEVIADGAAQLRQNRPPQPLRLPKPPAARNGS